MIACSVIWGDDVPDFENAELADLILGTIMGRHNEIVESLEIQPIFWQTDDGTVIAGDWAEGFLDAMRLGSVEWAEMLNDEDACLPLAPIIALAQDEGMGPPPIGEVDGQMQLQATCADLIPSCVVEIDAYWKARRG